MSKKTFRLLAMGAVGAMLLVLPAIAASASSEEADEALRPDSPKVMKSEGLEPIKGDIDDAEIQMMESQQDVHEVLDRILDALPAEKLLGYSMTRMAEDGEGAVLYWKGKPPTEVLDLTQRSDITVSIVQATYSEHDQQGIVDLITENWNPEWGSFTGLATVNSEGNILQLIWMPAKGYSARDVKAGLKRVLPEIEQAHFEEDRIVPAAATRWDDLSPWNSGGGLAAGAGASNTVCTIGAPVRRSGTTFLLTAGHCGTRAFTDGTGQTIGSTSQNWFGSGKDFQLVNARGSALLFYGAWNNSTGPTKQINGKQGNAVGDIVCQSGANSGEHCGMRIYDSFLDEVNMRRWIASNSDSPLAVMVAGGDSGAGVYHRGDTKARYHGMLTGYLESSEISCGTTPMRLKTHCGRVMVFYSISQVLEKTGATLLTV